MSYNEAETRFFLIDPVLREKGYGEHRKLRLESPTPVEPTGHKARRRAGSGRTDYLPCVHGRTVDAALARLRALLAFEHKHTMEK